MPRYSGQFKFNRQDNIGTAAAEEDGRFLRECFVDTGELGILSDFSDPRCIVSGRTGTGKTALLSQLQVVCKSVIEITPESLSLNYIANSTVIRFVSDLGVNLDPFYKLLWRHVFAVEILKKTGSIGTPEAKRRFLGRFFEASADRQKRERSIDRQKKAFAYLDRFGESFWKDTDYRTKEITRTFEQELTQGLGVSLGFGADMGTPLGKIGAQSKAQGEIRTGNKMSTAEKAELVRRGQEVINSVQVRELSEILTLLNEVLDEQYAEHVLVIDRLDESWVDDSIRYRLIRALIDTVREFRRVKKVKVVIALRDDLFERVIRETRDAGFQEEKFQALRLPIRWSRRDLIRLLDKRIQKLVRDRYTSATITHSTLLPAGLIDKSERKRKNPIDYILDRTWKRPRDVIEFMNLCIQKAKDKSKFTKTMITAAEGEYSRLRLRSLADEWYSDVPYLIDSVELLKKRPSLFELGELEDSLVTELCLELALHGETSGSIAVLASQVVDDRLSISDFRARYAAQLYRIGIIGLKTESFEHIHWAESDRPSISSSDIDDGTLLAIHPGLWRVLGIVPKK